MSNAAVERYVRDFQAVRAHLPGAALPWLQTLREEALDRFVVQGFPTVRDEAWKYTRVGFAEKQAWQPNAGAPSPAHPEVRPWRLDETAHRLVFVDGRYVAALSQVGHLSGKAVVMSLAEALAQCPQIVEPHLAGAPGEGAFAQLNAAFATDGAFIHLSDGIALEEPVHLLFFGSAAGTVSHIRNIVVAGKVSSATIVEHYVGAGEGYFSNAYTQLVIADNAHVEHYKVQQESADAFHVASIVARQATDSRFDSHSISLGGDLARTDIATRFDGSGCRTTLNGLYVTAGRQHVDHHTLIDHAQPHGTSREFYRGILDDASRAVFNGRIVVHKDAQKTDAAQSNHNLLLSRDAEVDTRPQLEIYADDVKCSHGATVGQLDENMLFYLRARGIDEEHAQDLLTYAFASEVLARVRIGSLRQRIADRLVARLHDSERLKELV